MKHFFAFLLMAAVVFPAIAFADADKIFRDNNGAVVVVVIYNEKSEQVSQGSGFVVRSDGVIVTNYHVITDTGDIKIKAGANIMSVEGVVFADKDNDIIILKAKAEKLQTVKTGDAGKVTVGEKIYVISSPQGLENTISDGIISGIREITPGKKMLQISAPISPGSSGGPVFNNDGEVIGIATFIISKVQNINFATPINVINGTITDRKITKLKDSGIEDPKKIWGYWFHVGLTNSNSGKWEEAMKAFKEAIKIQPDLEYAHYNLGADYLAADDRNSALEEFKILKGINAESANKLFNLIYK